MRKTNQQQILESVYQDLSLTTLLIKSVQSPENSNLNYIIVQKQRTVVPFVYIWALSVLFASADSF